jgi:4-hydroxy-4-methyl-2-oxoglutarate aldolase
MYELGVVYRNIQRADRDVAAEAGRARLCNRARGDGPHGLMKPYMRPIYRGASVGGAAVTVLLQPGDNWMLHVAAEQIQPGDIVVPASRRTAPTAISAICWRPASKLAAPSD